VDLRGVLVDLEIEIERQFLKDQKTKAMNKNSEAMEMKHTHI